MSKWQMKRCFTSLFILEIYIQFAMGYHYIPIRIDNMKQTENTKCWWGREVRKILVCVASITFITCFGKVPFFVLFCSTHIPSSLPKSRGYTISLDIVITAVVSICSKLSHSASFRGDSVSFLFLALWTHNII